jgi:hypothetical protein
MRQFYQARHVAERAGLDVSARETGKRGRDSVFMWLKAGRVRTTHRTYVE